jgi:hypothetical protein
MRRWFKINPGETLSTGEVIFIFCIEALILYLLALPSNLWFESYLLRDPAEGLGFHYLLSHGYRLNLDFGYYYGLLSLLSQELLFAVLRPTYWAAEANATLAGLVIAIGLAIFASKTKIGSLGFCLFVVTMPFTVTYYRNWEAALLSLALAEHASGRRNWALAFSTAACFAKPVMGYFYDLLLIVLILVQLQRKKNLTLRAIVRAFSPALAVGFCLTILLMATFGPWALITTILPLRGAANYRALHYGFFSGGGRLYYFPGVHLAYYFGTPTAFWLIGSVCLIVSGVRALRDLLVSIDLNPEERLNRELVITCTILHMTFVIFFFGPPSSWTYYSYVLVMGLGATAAWYRRVGHVSYAPVMNFVTALVLLAILGSVGFFRDSYQRWAHGIRSEETAGLWAFPDERDEWIQVRRTIKGARSATLLVPMCGGELLYPEFEKPVAAFVLPGQSVPSEVSNKVQQLSRADFIVRPTQRAFGGDPDQVLHWWPELKPALDGSKMVFHGEFFDVYERSSTSNSTAPSGHIER